MSQHAGTSRQRLLQSITIIADMMDCDLLAFGLSKHRVRRSVVVNQVNWYRFVMCSEAPDTLDPLPFIFLFSKRRQGVINQPHQPLRIHDTGRCSFARRQHCHMIFGTATPHNFYRPYTSEDRQERLGSCGDHA